MDTRSWLAAAIAVLLWAPGAVAVAQDPDIDGRTTRAATDLVSAIAEMATRDVAGAICADSRHRQASVLVMALASRERRLRAALARRDGTIAREERAVMHGLRDSIRRLHAEAASCVGATVVEPSPDDDWYACTPDVPPDVPDDAMRIVGDSRRSAISE